MNKNQLINNIIKSNKWVKNDMDMVRVQCSSLILTNMNIQSRKNILNFQKNSV